MSISFTQWFLCLSDSTNNPPGRLKQNAGFAPKTLLITRLGQEDTLSMWVMLQLRKFKSVRHRWEVPSQHLYKSFADLTHF